jgi:hypothetical protein
VAFGNRKESEKGFGTINLYRNADTIPTFDLEGLRKSTWNLSHVRWCHGYDLKLKPLK